ncbi:hypothetical protein SLS62_007165 [Diatrype stigma]|uniref:Dienelactone hydrolase domain-containing protein n=1 Tax=Diatrype stigma TaxID=117547 RepID=A0AAN9YQK3_9PEZI
MTEADVATKAPESDAQERMGEHSAGEAPKGEIRKLGGIDIYLAKPDSYPSNPSRLLLLLTGGTGLKSANNQIQADKFAAEGYVVVMPDLFEGDPAPNGSSTTVPERAESEGGSSSFLDAFKLKAVETAKSFLIDMWLARHAEEKVWPILEKVIHAAEGEFADAVGNGGGIYAVGYCFGARYVLLLAGERPSDEAAARASSWTGARHQPPADEERAEPAKPEKKGPYIKAGALAHATLVSPDDFQGLKVPVSLVCVEDDPMFPDDVRTAGEDVMSKNNLEHEVQVYPGVPHGFAVIGDYDDPNIKEAQVTAYEQMLKWINEH